MTHLVPSLTPATLAILVGLGAGRSAPRAAPVTDPARAATGPAEPVTEIFPLKSDTYHGGVTRAHAYTFHAVGSDEWEERAAILEHEGGHARATAEWLASLLLSKSQMDGPSAETCALERKLIEMDRLRD